MALVTQVRVPFPGPPNRYLALNNGPASSTCAIMVHAQCMHVWFLSSSSGSPLRCDAIPSARAPSIQVLMTHQDHYVQREGARGRTEVVPGGGGQTRRAGGGGRRGDGGWRGVGRGELGADERAGISGKRERVERRRVTRSRQGGWAVVEGREMADGGVEREADEEGGKRWEEGEVGGGRQREMEGGRRQREMEGGKRQREMRQTRRAGSVGGGRWWVVKGRQRVEGDKKQTGMVGSGRRSERVMGGGGRWEMMRV
ncbi:hypothetical protein BC826DRAFT_973782 [Russula brevipes]|nr:hypothetical protein BC826DRAFT_973782 [Russula brevipes]